MPEIERRGGRRFGYDIVDARRRYTYSRLAPTGAPLPAAEQVQSDLVCASPSRIYYRSAGNELCGYVRQGRTWYALNLSCSAAGPAATRPVPLAGGLAVNVAGTVYYRGTDGQLHGFAPLDAQGWSYEYFDLPVLNAAKPGKQLVATPGDRLFYTSGQDGRVYGVQRTPGPGADTTPAGHGRWASTEGSWGAQLTPDGLPDQVPAAGELAVSPDGQLLAYVGRDGMLHGLRLPDAATVEYLDFPAPPSPDLAPTQGMQLCSATQLCYVTAAHQLVVATLTGQFAACANPALAAMRKPYNKAMVAPRPAAQAPAASLRHHLNPAINALQVELVGSTSQLATQVAMYNILGQQVQTGMLAADANQPGVLSASLPVLGLVPGVYTLAATDGAGQRCTSQVAVLPTAR